jgi:hypothetical protein
MLAGWLLALGALAWKADDVAGPAPAAGMAGAATAGAATAGAATLLRVVAVVLATGVVALVDDAAANVLAPAPVTLAWRSGVRFATAALAVAVPWSVALLWVRPGYLAAGLTLECAALTAVALTVTVGVARWSDAREPSVVAGPAVLGAAAFGALLPQRWAMFATPGSGWAVAHARWAVVLVVAVALLAVLVRDPAARRVRS